MALLGPSVVSDVTRQQTLKRSAEKWLRAAAGRIGRTE
jgi:hypothetical protein